MTVEGGKDPQDALRCTSFPAKEALLRKITGRAAACCHAITPSGQRAIRASLMARGSVGAVRLAAARPR